MTLYSAAWSSPNCVIHGLSKCAFLKLPAALRFRSRPCVSLDLIAMHVLEGIAGDSAPTPEKRSRGIFSYYISAVFLEFPTWGPN